MSRRPFRFGVVAVPGPDWLDAARRLEDQGFDILLMPDRPRLPSPLPALAAAAAVTSRLRVGTFVLAAGNHDPEVVVRDCRTVSQLSNGRFEPGLGAGIEREGGGDPVERLAALARRLKGELPDARVLIAASGRRGLAEAARLADVVTISMPAQAAEGRVLERIGWLRESAGDRAAEIELNLNLATVGDAANPYFAAMGIDPAELRAAGSPAALWGDTDEMCDLLEGRRERLGVSYWTAPIAMFGLLAPVVARLRGR